MSLRPKTVIPQREHFDRPELLSPAWTLKKGQKTADCNVWSNQFGFELRLTVGTELLQSQVCGTQEKLIELLDEWKAAMHAKGWA